MHTAKELKKIKKMQKNNQFFAKMFHFSEKIRSDYLIQNPEKLKIIVDYIKENGKDVKLITKVDKRSTNIEDIQIYFDNGEYDKIFKNFYFTSFLVELPKDKMLSKINNYHMSFCNELLILNYPLVFDVVYKTVKATPSYHIYFNDIKNTTMEVIVSSIVKFNLSKGFMFSTYLSYWVKYGVDEELKYILADIKMKYSNNVPIHYRFIGKIFIDKSYDMKILRLNDIVGKSSIGNEKKKELREKIDKLKKERSDSYKKYIQRVLDSNFNFFELLGFNISYESSVKSLIDSLNKIITKKEYRDKMLKLIKKYRPEHMNYFTTSKSQKEAFYIILFYELRGKEPEIVSELGGDSLESIDMQSETEENEIYESIYKLIPEEYFTEFEDFVNGNKDTLNPEIRKYLKKKLSKTDLESTPSDYEKIIRF